MKYTILFILLVLVSGAAQAQVGNLTGISYNMAYTGPNTREYIDNYSWRGLGFEYRGVRSENLTVGVSMGWNIFRERTSGMVELDQGAVSGTQTRHLGIYPFLLNTHYYFGTRDDISRPFIGINAGTYYISQKFDIGVFEFDKGNWHFGLAPEAGVLLPVGDTFSDTFLLLGIKYNYAFAAGESLAGESRSYSFWGFNVGVVFFAF